MSVLMVALGVVVGVLGWESVGTIIKEVKDHRGEFDRMTNRSLKKHKREFPFLVSDIEEEKARNQSLKIESKLLNELYNVKQNNAYYMEEYERVQKEIRSLPGFDEDDRNLIELTDHVIDDVDYQEEVDDLINTLKGIRQDQDHQTERIDALGIEANFKGMKEVVQLQNELERIRSLYNIKQVPLVEYLRSNNYDPSFAGRASIAVQLNIVDRLDDYKGHMAQNLQIYINVIQITEKYKGVYHGFHGQLNR